MQSNRPKGVMHKVPLTADKDEAGHIRFRPHSDLWDSNGMFKFHKDDHGMSKQDFHLVEYVLDDRTGEGLKFPSVPHDAMWVAAIEDPDRPVCPGKDTKSDYSVLEPISVCDQGQRLIVRNENPRREQWAFTLNFVKGGADERDVDDYVSWDPITDNHNGGTMEIM